MRARKAKLNPRYHYSLIVPLITLISLIGFYKKVKNEKTISSHSIEALNKPSGR